MTKVRHFRTIALRSGTTKPMAIERMMANGISEADATIMASIGGLTPCGPDNDIDAMRKGLDVFGLVCVLDEEEVDEEPPETAVESDTGTGRNYRDEHFERLSRDVDESTMPHMTWVLTSPRATSRLYKFIAGVSGPAHNSGWGPNPSSPVLGILCKLLNDL
jgi:hypothetical protein